MNEFTDSQFMPAQEKRSVIRGWELFLRKGFKPQHFTRALYLHLTLRCEFIAHFSRAGFYQVYFSDPEATIRFLRQFDSDCGFLSVEYGSDRWICGEYADVNRAMCRVVEGVKGRLYAELAQKVRERDLAIAGQLLAKHGTCCLASSAFERSQGSSLQRTAEPQ